LPKNLLDFFHHLQPQTSSKKRSYAIFALSTTSSDKPFDSGFIRETSLNVTKKNDESPREYITEQIKFSDKKSDPLRTDQYSIESSSDFESARFLKLFERLQRIKEQVIYTHLHKMWDTLQSGEATLDISDDEEQEPKQEKTFSQASFSLATTYTPDKYSPDKIVRQSSLTIPKSGENCMITITIYPKGKRSNRTECQLEHSSNIQNKKRWLKLYTHMFYLKRCVGFRARANENEDNIYGIKGRTELSDDEEPDGIARLHKDPQSIESRIPKPALSINKLPRFQLQRSPNTQKDLMEQNQY